jgi:hypothetical protein
MDLPEFEEAWQELRLEYEQYGDFASFIDKMRNESQSR